MEPAEQRRERFDIDRVSVVFTNEKADSYRIGQLLQNIGFKVEKEKTCSFSNELRDVVICHRRSVEFPAPVIPVCKEGQRLVVLSDCNDEESIVLALEKGAHHVFDISESTALLRVRLSAALRRHSNIKTKPFSVPPFTFYPDRRSVHDGTCSIPLAPKEYALAAYLFTERHRTVTKSELLTAVWSLPHTVTSRRIDTTACRLKRKMGLDSNSGWQLKQVRGVGFRLVWHTPIQQNKNDNNTVFAD